MFNFTEEENQTTQCDDDHAFNPPSPTPTNFSVSRSSTSQLQRSYLHLGFCSCAIQIITFISIPIRSMYFPNELLKKSAQERCLLTVSSSLRLELASQPLKAKHYSLSWNMWVWEGQKLFTKTHKLCKTQNNIMAKENVDLTLYIILRLNHKFCSLLVF